MTKAQMYEILAAKYNENLKHYNKGKKANRWEASSPEDRDSHGHEVGFLNGLNWAMDALFPIIKPKGTKQ